MLHSDIAKGDHQPWSGDIALSLDALPPRFNRRWTPALQSQVLAAIDGGLLTAAEAEARYALSVGELEGWRAATTAQREHRSLAESPSPAVETAQVDRLSRLVAVLFHRGLIDELDVASLSMSPDVAMQTRISAFLIDDEPLF